MNSVKLSKDQDHGIAWGKLVWRGRPKQRIQKIGPARKGGWSLLSTPDYHAFKGNADHLNSPLLEKIVNLVDGDNTSLSKDIEKEKIVM